MRKTIIAGNWKMNKTIAESVSLVKELKKISADVRNREIIVCPAFTSLSAVAAELKSSNIKVGAQNMHFEKNGAFTGEISALMLKDIPVDYVILGHSERRHVFGEGDELINKKVKAALLNGLNSIFCVGETLKERESGKTKDVIGNQVLKGLKDVSKKDIRKVVIAYEPVWAIGTGKTAAPEQAEEAHLFIRKLLGKIFDDNTSNSVSILYGGSVKPDNIKELIAKENIDGALVGGASLDAKIFYQIIKC
ncbi:MAG: triose-phosphate isomerase [Nanoarchaeota archaeon]|nr:triose-phosphate isomerase [Nanoarchaeota archaeon]MBU1004916.1 triose-phosphate isomerase [Nanoarchaeota archaeon]MBU1945638.1 triose-phosphate isomerase [Nanoarchaeota archaeon]